MKWQYRIEPAPNSGSVEDFLNELGQDEWLLIAAHPGRRPGLIGNLVLRRPYREDRPLRIVTEEIVERESLRESDERIPRRAY